MAATSSFTEGVVGLRRTGEPAPGARDHLHRLRRPTCRRPHHLPVGDDRRRHPADHRQGQATRGSSRRASTSSTPTRPATSARTSSGSRTCACPWRGRSRRRSRSRDSSDRRQINIVPGFVEPSDMRELRRLAEADRAARDDVPRHLRGARHPADGAPRVLPGGRGHGRRAAEPRPRHRHPRPGLLGLARGRRRGRSGGRTCRARSSTCPSASAPPTGSSSRLAFRGGEVPRSLDYERGQLVDLIVDTQQHFHGKKVAIFGDPDHVLALTEFCRDLGMVPVHVLTGTPGKRFVSRGGADPRDPARTPRTCGPRATCSCSTSGSRTSRWTCSSATPTASTSPAPRTSRSSGSAGRSSTGSATPYLPTVGYNGAVRLVEPDAGRPARPPGPGRPGRRVRARPLAVATVLAGRAGQVARAGAGSPVELDVREAVRLGVGQPAGLHVLRVAGGALPDRRRPPPRPRPDRVRGLHLGHPRCPLQRPRAAPAELLDRPARAARRLRRRAASSRRASIELIARHAPRAAFVYCDLHRRRDRGRRGRVSAERSPSARASR